MNDQMNQGRRGNTLCSDGADHDALRNVLVRPLTPRALRPVREEITAEAESVGEKLVTATVAKTFRPVSPHGDSPRYWLYCREATARWRRRFRVVAPSRIQHVRR